MKLAFVVQRYGEMVVGGAESYCRQLAEELADRGHDVHVYTTAAVNERTWANALPEGSSQENKVHVHRLKTVIQRMPVVSGLILRFFAVMNGIFRALGLQEHSFVISFAAWLESLFFILQGPWSPSLVRRLSEDQESYDAVCYVTYLFYPTVFGLRRINRPRFLIPTAHDERAFYLSSITRLLRDASGIFALSKAESELISARLPAVKSKIQILGYGINLSETGDGLSTEVISKLPAGDFLLFLGRISPGKGVETLLDYMERLQSQGLSDVSLVLAGVTQDIDIPSVKHVVYLGKVSEADKFNLMKKSLAVVNPSPHESLSMVVIEAIACGVPVLVNSDSPVLKSYTQNYETVLGFSDFAQFSQNVRQLRTWRLEGGSEDARKKLKQSSEWAKSEYSWDEVISRFLNNIKR